LRTRRRAGSVSERVRAAILRYNRYRRPEIVARLERLDGRQLVVSFRGSSCRSCGSYDHMEDFAIEASDLLGVEVRLHSFQPSGTMGYRAEYVIEENLQGSERSLPRPAGSSQV